MGEYDDYADADYDAYGEDAEYDDGYYAWTRDGLSGMGAANTIDADEAALYEPMVTCDVVIDEEYGEEDYSRCQ